jgi:hypothetical protein
MDEPAEWAQRQFGAVDLGNRRSNRRAVIVGEAMARRLPDRCPCRLGGTCWMVTR